MNAERKLLAISRIRVDGGTQTRAGIRPDVVEEYADVLANGGELPPVTVFDDGTDLWMAEGFHRQEAYLKAGKTEMPVEIWKGTKRDALLYSAGANAKHGLRRSNEDKRKAIKMLLADDEWAEKSDRWIAEQCHVSEHTVATVRGESTAQTRSCPQKPEKNGQEPHSANVQRTGKDGKERPAKRPSKVQVLCERCQRVGVVKGCEQCAAARTKHETRAEGELEEGEIVDDEDFTVPAAHRQEFSERELYRNAARLATMAANAARLVEASKSYKATETGQSEDRSIASSAMLTFAKRFTDREPSTMCSECHGSGCAKCKRGWFTAGEKTYGS